MPLKLKQREKMTTPDPAVVTNPAEHPKLKELLPKLDALEKALLATDPKMPVHLREIHKYLIQFEELAHLLTEEQISKIVQGQEILTSTKLADETKAGKGPGSKRGKGAPSAEEL